MELDVLPSSGYIINYENIKTLSYATMLISDFSTIDTIAVFDATRDPSITNEKRDKEKLYNWLKYKLKKDTLVVR